MSLKFLIIGDLHGKKPKIKKSWLKDIDAILAVGDFCKADEIRKYAFEAIRKSEEMDKEIRWYEIVGQKRAEKILKKSLKSGRKILEYLNSLGKLVFTVPGNLDFAFANKNEKWKMERINWYKKFLIKDLENVIDTDIKLKKYKDIILIGYGKYGSPEFRKEIRKDKRKFKKFKKLLKKLEELFKKANTQRALFISHNVPYNTKIDIITNKESPAYGKHYGSNIVRKIIEKYQPIANIAGHMHEHFTSCKIGRTLCINAGYRKVSLLEIGDGKVRWKKLTS